MRLLVKDSKRKKNMLKIKLKLFFTLECLLYIHTHTHTGKKWFTSVFLYVFFSLLLFFKYFCLYFLLNLCLSKSITCLASVSFDVSFHIFDRYIISKQLCVPANSNLRVSCDKMPEYGCYSHTQTFINCCCSCN